MHSENTPAHVLKFEIQTFSVVEKEFRRSILLSSIVSKEAATFLIPVLARSYFGASSVINFQGFDYSHPITSYCNLSVDKAWQDEVGGARVRKMFWRARRVRGNVNAISLPRRFARRVQTLWYVCREARFFLRDLEIHTFSCDSYHSKHLHFTNIPFMIASDILFTSFLNFLFWFISYNRINIYSCVDASRDFDLVSSRWRKAQLYACVYNSWPWYFINFDRLLSLASDYQMSLVVCLALSISIQS